MVDRGGGGLTIAPMRGEAARGRERWMAAPVCPCVALGLLGLVPRAGAVRLQRLVRSRLRLSSVAGQSPASGTPTAVDNGFVHPHRVVWTKSIQMCVVAAAAAIVACDLPEMSMAAERSGGTRPPTRTERVALDHATYASDVGDKGIDSILISVPDSRYAVVRWNNVADRKDWFTRNLFRRSQGDWHLIYRISGHGLEGGRASADGACAVAPGAVVRVLYGYRCSFTCQLHARPAPGADRHAMQKALTSWSVGSTLGPQRIGRACISRVDPKWAAANGTTLVWFKRYSTWRVVYADGDPGPKPPHAIVLSLGSCVGYFPSDFY